jgi:hypothetical protein
MSYRRVADALFDSPHVGAVHAGLIGKIFLRPALDLSQLPDPFAQRFRDGIGAFFHAVMFSCAASPNRPTNGSHSCRNVSIVRSAVVAGVLA